MILSRRRLLAGCAHRTARYKKKVRQRRAAWTVGGARCERDARLRPARGRQQANSYHERFGTPTCVPRPPWTAPQSGWKWARQNSGSRYCTRGERAAVRVTAPAMYGREGLIHPRASAYFADRTPTVRPDPWDSGPTYPARDWADKRSIESARGCLATSAAVHDASLVACEGSHVSRPTS